MRARLDEADAVGFAFMRQVCGQGNKIDLFFNGVRILERKLYSVQASLANTGNALQCPKISMLYSSLMEESVCTDMASANANGFILLLLVAFSNMILITLRASWRRHSYKNDNAAETILGLPWWIFISLVVGLVLGLFLCTAMAVVLSHY